MCTRAGSGHRLAPTAQQEMPPHCRQRRLSLAGLVPAVHLGKLSTPESPKSRGLVLREPLEQAAVGVEGTSPAKAAASPISNIGPHIWPPSGGGGPRGLSVLVLMDGGVPPPNPREQAAEAQTGGAGVRRLGAGREKSWLGRGLHWLCCQDRVPSRSHGAPDAEREPRRRAHRVRPQQRGIPGLGASWSPPEAKTEA